MISALYSYLKLQDEGVQNFKYVCVPTSCALHNFQNVEVSCLVPEQFKIF